MTSYRFDVGPQARFVSRLVGRIRGELAQAVTDAQTHSGMTIDDIAQKIGVTPGEVEQLLSGESGLSLRQLAQMLAALDRDVTFAIDASSAKLLENHVQQTTTIGGAPVLSFGSATRETTTICGMQQAIRKLVHAGGS